jgi:superfamily II DNA or RNA helicase
VRLCDNQHPLINTPYGNVKKYSGLKNRPLLIKYLQGKYFSAKSDKPLPEIYRQNIVVSGIKNRELIEQLEKDFAGNHISTAKKNIAVEKSVFTVKYLKDCIASAETPLLVFSDHVDSCRAIKNQLSVGGIKNVEVITGSTQPEERSNRKR